MLFITIIDRYGRIRYVDEGSKPGGIKEKTAFSRFEMNRDYCLPNGIRLLGDGAYTELDSCYAPFGMDDLKSEPPGANKESMKKFNKRLRKYRVLVEWTFGTLKRNWNILSDKWRNDVRWLPSYFLCCCLLYNWLRRERKIEDDALDRIDYEVVDIQYPPRPDEGIMNN